MPEIELDKVVLIAVGADLRAEVADRPLAYRLRQAMGDWIERHVAEPTHRPEPIVCTDVWYLNHEELQRRPVVAIGGPGVNAVSGALYPRLPAALAVDERYLVQLDTDLTDLRAAAWGMDRRQTAAAIEAFEGKYLGPFLRACLTQVEPDE